MFTIVTVTFITFVILVAVKFRPRGAKRGYTDMTREEIALLLANDQKQNPNNQFGGNRFGDY